MNQIVLFFYNVPLKIERIVYSLLQHNLLISNFAWWLSLIAFVIVLIIETGRLPYDNPDTHLELTMMHESMLLEYSGRYLGLMLFTAQIKQLLLITILINLFFPWGIAIDISCNYMIVGLGVFLLKVFSVGILLGIIETIYAKIRLFLVPNLIVASISLSVLALIFQLVNY